MLWTIILGGLAGYGVYGCFAGVAAIAGFVVQILTTFLFWKIQVAKFYFMSCGMEYVRNRNWSSTKHSQISQRINPFKKGQKGSGYCALN